MAQTEQTTEQKRQAILDAVERGQVSGAKLEPSRKGATVSRMKGGKPVTPEAIDRLYARLLELQEQAGAGAETARPDQEPGKKRQARPKPKTAPVADAAGPAAPEISGQAIAELAALRARIEELERENSKLKEQPEQREKSPVEQTEQITVQTEQATEQKAQALDPNITGILQGISDRLEALEREFAQGGKGQNKQTEQKVQITEQDTEQKAEQARKQAPVILGFRLVQKTTRTAGKCYVKWYAARGAKHVVYIGGDTSQAEAKIKTYLAKHPEIDAVNQSVNQAGNPAGDKQA